MEKWYKTTIEEEFRKNPKLTHEMIADMKDWIISQPYLPQSLTDMELIFHIHSCEFDLDAAKKTLDINYSVRTNAEFFKHRDPQCKELESYTHCLQQFVISRIDAEGNHGILCRLEDPDPSKYIYDQTARYCMMLMDMVRIENGTVPGFVAIIDLTGFCVSHLFKVPFGSLRHMMKYLQDGTPTKIKSMHLVNTRGSIIDKVMVLLKPMLSEKMAQMMHFHPGYDTLYEHGIIRRILPTEYGGSAGTYRELTDETLENLKNYTEFFKEEENHRINESKRPRTKYFGIF